jgi:hypothetical protein
MKLSTSFTPTPRLKETLTLGTYTIPTVEQDYASDDYRGGIPSLMQPFEIYGQILVQFAPPVIRQDLQFGRSCRQLRCRTRENTGGGV